MPNKTEHFKLNQWEPEDDFLRTDFNEDNSTLETALINLQHEIAARPRIYLGSYTGECAKSTTTPQSITLGFRPRALFIMRADYNDHNYGAMIHEGIDSHGTLVITDTGFTVWNNSVSGQVSFLNHINIRYSYIAFY